MMIWLDLETTGLDPEEDAILEVAAVATTDALEEVAVFQAVTNKARGRAFNTLRKEVKEMHLANGLWVESLTSGLDEDKVEHDLVEWIKSVHEAGPRDPQWLGGPGPKPVLAGSGVHFDRAFLRRHMRRAHDQLHYRNVCTSTLYETARRFWPQVAAGGPRPDGNHRALSDVRASIATYRYYLREIVPWGTNARSSGEPGFADVDVSAWSAAKRGDALRTQRAEPYTCRHCQCSTANPGEVCISCACL